MSPGFVLDSGGLVAPERPSSGRRLALVLEGLEHQGTLIVSAAALAQVWRGSGRQAALALLLRRPATQVVEITTAVAKAIGVLLGRHPEGEDMVDAHVVMLARHYHFPVITSDPVGLLALDPELPHVRI